MEQENCNWFVFYKDQILILQTENGYHVPCCTEPPVAVPIGSTIHTIGEMNGHPHSGFRKSGKTDDGTSGFF